jgi:hypothetical protein
MGPARSEERLTAHPAIPASTAVAAVLSLPMAPAAAPAVLVLMLAIKLVPCCPPPASLPNQIQCALSLQSLTADAQCLQTLRGDRRHPSISGCHTTTTHDLQECL